MARRTCVLKPPSPGTVRGLVLVQCKHCGAPLDVKQNDRLVRCSYCDHVNRVRTMQTLNQMTPADWRPPPTWTPPPQFPVRPPQPLQIHPVKPPTNRAGCIVAIAIFLGVVPMIVIPILSEGGIGHSLPFIGLEENGAATVATVDLPVSRTLSGDTDDDVDASGIQGTGLCRGSIPRRPQFVLRAQQPMRVRLAVSAPIDSVMVVRRPDGTYVCDDDTAGDLDPLIETEVGAGDTRVWVGEFSDDGSSFTLQLDVEEGAIDPARPPSLAAIVANGPITEAYPGHTRGSVAIGAMGPGCRGAVPAGPHLTVQASERQLVRFVTSDNSGDVVMMVRSPSGAIACDDDGGGGGNPQLDVMLEPGVTAVWVGTYHEDDSYDFVLHVGAPGRQTGAVTEALDDRAPPLLGRVDLDRAPELTTYEGVTDPTLDANQLDPRCRGYIGRRPDLVLENRTPRDVELTTMSSADLVLVVRNEDGSFTCDDDSGEGQNAQIHQRWLSGVHQVWVGTYSPGGRVPFRVRLREQRAATRRGIDHPPIK